MKRIVLPRSRFAQSIIIFVSHWLSDFELSTDAKKYGANFFLFCLHRQTLKWSETNWLCRWLAHLVFYTFTQHFRINTVNLCWNAFCLDCANRRCYCWVFFPLFLFICLFILFMMILSIAIIIKSTNCSVANVLLLRSPRSPEQERARKRAHFNWFIHRPQKVLMLHIQLPFHIKFNTSTQLMSEIYDRRYQLRHTRFNFFFCFAHLLLRRVRSNAITCFSARSFHPQRMYKYTCSCDVISTGCLNLLCSHKTHTCQHLHTRTYNTFD